MSKKRSALLFIVEERADEKETVGAVSKKKRSLLLKKNQIQIETLDTAVKTGKEVKKPTSETEPSSCTHTIPSCSAKDQLDKFFNDIKGESRDPCDKCLYCSDHCPQPITEKKRYRCSNCKDNGLRRAFATQEKLDNHVKSTHDAEDSKVIFICQECDDPPLEFKSKARYMYHLGSKHQGALYFVCEICAATFKMKANYKEHLATHNIPSKKPFVCEVCKGSFVNKAGFESHKKRFPGPHVKHVCEHCNFSFSKESHIANHRCKKLLLEEAAARAAEAVDKSTAVTEPSTSAVVNPSSTSSSQTQYFRPVSVADPVVLQDIQQEAPPEQIIIRDMAGHVIQGSQVLQFDISDTSGGSPQHVYHVNVADWNMVAPFVIRDPNIQIMGRPSE